MQITNERFIVLDVPGFPGLLVSDYVYKPGRIFYRNEWKWGDDVLRSAIEKGRCKLVVDSPKEKSETAKPEEKSAKQKKLESLIAKWNDLDPQSDKAKKLEDEISKLESEIAEED